MIYRLNQIALWPRLVDGARAVDAELAAGIAELAREGAHAEWAAGDFTMHRGSMTTPAYERVKGMYLTPKLDKLRMVLSTIPWAPHPWVALIKAAADDLVQRCEKAAEALDHAAGEKDTERFKTLRDSASERFWQAELVCGVLADLEHEEYATHVSKARTSAEALHAPYPAAGVYWPIETPDGWFWLVDQEGTAPQTVKFGGGRPRKDPAPDDLVIPWVLLTGDPDTAGLLRPLPYGQARRAG